MRTIFVVDSEIANSYGTLSPLIRRYSDEYPLGVVLSHRTRGLIHALKAHLPSTTLYFDADRWRRHDQSLSRACQEPEHAAAMVRHFGLGSLCYLLTDAVRAEALQVLSAATGNLRNVIVGNERAHLSALAVATWKESARTICVQHGVPTLEYLPVGVAHYWAWNPRFAEWFRKRAERTKVTVAGNPRDSADTSSASTSLGSPFRLLLLGQPLGLDFPVPGMLAILDLLRGLTGAFEVRVRLHPADKLDAYPLPYRQWLQDHLDNRKALREALHGADAVVSYASTALFEAVEQGKPAVVLDPPPAPVVSEELFTGFPRARSVAELTDVLIRLRQLRSEGLRLPKELHELQSELLGNRFPTFLNEAIIDRLCADAATKIT